MMSLKTDDQIAVFPSTSPRLSGLTGKALSKKHWFAFFIQESVGVLVGLNTVPEATQTPKRSSISRNISKAKRILNVFLKATRRMSKCAENRNLSNFGDKN